MENELLKEVKLLFDDVNIISFPRIIFTLESLGTCCKKGIAIGADGFGAILTSDFLQDSTSRSSFIFLFVLPTDALFIILCWFTGWAVGLVDEIGFTAGCKTLTTRGCNIWLELRDVKAGIWYDR